MRWLVALKAGPISIEDSTKENKNISRKRGLSASFFRPHGKALIFWSLARHNLAIFSKMVREKKHASLALISVRYFQLVNMARVRELSRCICRGPYIVTAVDFFQCLKA